MTISLLKKILGTMLILSGLVLALLKLSSLPEARGAADAWAYPESGLLWFIAGLAIEFMFLLARFILGYFVYTAKPISSWAFYLLAVMVSLSGLTGMVLGLALVLLAIFSSTNKVKT
jgi:hypothetical protein